MTNQNRKNLTKISFLGEISFPTGLDFNGTEVGGLSGITYDANQGIYYTLSDEGTSNARFYSLNIDLSDGNLNDGDIVFNSVTNLQDTSGNPFTNGSLDPEGIALTENGNLFIASEGDVENSINPFINEFSSQGRQINELTIPEKFNPTENKTSGIRDDLAFESLTITPNQRYLYTATENALFQDGSQADVGQGSLSRIIKYDLTTRQPVGEFVYQVDEVAIAPNSDLDFPINGLVELLAIDNNGTLLALERSFTPGDGYTVKLYEVQTQGALDVSSQDNLFDESGNSLFEIDPTVEKRLLLDFADLGITPDNLEGLALGPKIADGDQSLIVVSDNNLDDTQTTQFIALGLDFNSTPAVLPTVETPNTIDREDVEKPALAGDADDPAIWLNPNNPEESIVIATLKDGGLATFNLQGEVQQVISATELSKQLVFEENQEIEFGDIRYNNVDIIYNFPLASMIADVESKVDLAIASDRTNDTLAIFTISKNGELEKLSTPELDDPNFSIFGVDDAEATAYGLATYTSQDSNKFYIFVTQASGNKVAQIELTSRLGPADEQLIEAEVVRTLELPIPEDGDIEEAQAEGLVIDQELGFLYVAMEEGAGILKFSASPDGGSNYTVVQPSQPKTDFQKQPFTDFITFGDSLADVGNVFIGTQQNNPPSPPYSNGRFSTGELVSEIIAEELGLSASTPSLMGGDNYAFGGAEAGSGTSKVGTPNVDQQINFYLAADAPTATDVFFISAGSNNFLPSGNINPTTVEIPTPESVLQQLTGNITTLAKAGAKNFIIPNLAPLGTTPRVGNIPGVNNTLNALSSQFNTLLDNELDELEDELGINIIELDIASEIATIQANPGDFGLTNIDASALNTTTGVVVPNPEEYFWWDDIHPTTTAYNLIVQGVIDDIPELEFIDTNTSPLVPDIEGLSIYYGADGNGYLIASSQGDSSYAVFSRGGDNEYLGSFVIGENNDIDQVNETDGLDIINVALGSEFPNGLLVVQDGANNPQNLFKNDEELENNNTNFKFIPWDAVANAFDNPLQIDTTSYNPRNSQTVVSLDINPPTVTGSTTPTDNGTDIAVDQNISFTLSEDVTAVAGKNITITDEDGNVTTITANDTNQVAIAGGTVTINPSTDLINGKQYTIVVESGAFTDAAGNVFDGTIVADGNFNFTTITTINTSSQSQPQSITPINTSNQDTNGNDIELIDLSAYSNQTVTASFEITREAAYTNNVYFYGVDNANGEIGSLAPNASGYLQAALNNVINSSNALTTANGQATTGTLEMAGGNMLGVLIIADGTLSEAKNNLDTVEGVYFSYIGANTDDGSFDHIKFENGTFKFEDLANGGDRDFDDIEIKIDFTVQS